MDRWQVVKNGVPVILCDTIEEAEKEYLKHDADEIRRIADDQEQELANDCKIYNKSSKSYSRS